MDDFIVPERVEDIAGMVSGRPAYFLAGGTDLMVKAKDNQAETGRIWVDLSRLKSLKGITQRDDHIVIGALTTMSDIISSELILEHAKTLHEAASLMGSPLIRNLATLGGNLANSNPAGDMIPPVHVLEASVITVAGSRSREIPVNEFCTGPCVNALDIGEIITHIKIPVRSGSASSFRRLAPRKALAISKVSVAVWWVKKKGVIEDVRIALGAVGPRCIRAKRTEDLLLGRTLNSELLDKAAISVRYEACPIDDFRSSKDYRREMTGVLLKRALAET